METDFNKENNWKAFFYSEGSWRDIDSPLQILTEYPEKNTWPMILHRSGYANDPAKFGQSRSFKFEVYHTATGREKVYNAPHKYLVVVSVAGYVQHIYVDNYRNLIHLIGTLSGPTSVAVD